MLKLTQILLSIIILLTVTISAQIDNSWKLYDDSQVARVDITVSPEHLQFMYNDPYADTLFPANVHYKNAIIDESIDSIGFGIRGNTSRASQKKSFKLSFNEYEKGKEFYDIEKMNLNGEHNDPSIIRSKLCWDLFNKIGMNASRACHTEVYINGQYYGLYISVEHIDDEFLKRNYLDADGNLWKCLYPADLDYIGDNPDLYKLVSDGRRVYELKTNEVVDDYSKLARLINIINNTPDAVFRDSIEKVLAVDEVLIYFAINVITGGWDSYRFLKNNYYLYHNPSEDKFHWVPYDYDNTFGIDWFNVDWGNVNPYNWANIDGTTRPLSERLLNVPEYKNLFTHFMDFYSNNVFNYDLWNEKIEDIRVLITDYALQDTFRIKDYGFTFSDFLNSYSASGYSNQHVKYGLKEFIIARNNSLNDQLNYVSSSPIIYDAYYEPQIIDPEDTIKIYASVFIPSAFNNLEVQFSNDGGNILNTYSMQSAKVEGTKKVEEFDRWIVKVSLEDIDTTNYFRIYVESDEGSQYYPANGFIKIETPHLITDNIVINEFLAFNENSIPDSAGEYDDWLEIYNPTNSTIDLTGMYLTDDSDSLTQWQFPSLQINPGEIVLVWCDEDLNQQGLHTNFKINGDGEFLALVNLDGITIIDSLTFGIQNTDVSFGRFPDGTDQWAFLQPTPASSNILTSIKEENIFPEEFKISVYPNPFNPSTTLRYSLPERGNVEVRIFDILGEMVWKNNLGEKNRGTYEFEWSGKNNFNSDIGSGVYILNIKSNNNLKAIKLLKIK